MAVHPGLYQYKFLVDGVWAYDKNELSITNSYGSINNIIEVFPASHETLTEHDSEDNEIIRFPSMRDNESLTTVKILTQMKGSSVLLRGSWDNWTSIIKMRSKIKIPFDYSEFVAYLKLASGKYEYKFIVDGAWQHEASKMTTSDGCGGLNNVIMVSKRGVEKENKGNRNAEGDLNVLNIRWRTVEIEELNFAAIQGHSMNFVADDIYIFGGFYHGKFCDVLYCLRIDDLEVRGIDTKGKAPEARAFHS